MKELGITISKILREWLQPKGEGDIVCTDDIAITAATHEIAEACHKEYDVLLKQQDKLQKQLNDAIATLRAIKTVNDAAIKSTDG